jgi:CubicO group peptidase (beta-lactamase class C family)
MVERKEAGELDQALLYYPGPGRDWERKTPGEVGLDASLLQEARAFSQDPAHVGYMPDLEAQINANIKGKRHDDGVILGPVKDHGPVAGVVVRHGYLVEEWGEPERVDMTFSVTKSFLCSVAAVAWDRGLIRDVHEPVRNYVDDDGFESPHNAKITWDHMLRQINEWDGTLWDKHYSAGNPDDVLRPVEEPSTVYEYNDVRVNRLALALLRVWRRPLPEVLREFVMNPIGASDTWQWHGYRNSWVTINGKEMQSVSGGGHWGGGMWISAKDLARFGYLTLRRGVWNGQQIISDEWIDMATTPTALCPTYGFMNWKLNTIHDLMPSAPENSYFHAGAGANRVYVDPEHDLVVVLRWVAPDYFAGFVKRVLDSVAQ